MLHNTALIPNSCEGAQIYGRCNVYHHSRLIVACPEFVAFDADNQQNLGISPFARRRVFGHGKGSSAARCSREEWVSRQNP
jgi:hypothetical protein